MCSMSGGSKDGSNDDEQSGSDQSYLAAHAITYQTYENLTNDCA